MLFQCNPNSKRGKMKQTVVKINEVQHTKPNINLDDS